MDRKNRWMVGWMDGYKKIDEWFDASKKMMIGWMARKN